MSRLQLQDITIQGYKSFEHQRIFLSGMNILIGQNGAGKSNFISLFRLLRSIIERKLKSYSLKIGVEGLLYYGSKKTKQIILNIGFEGFSYGIVLQPSISGNLFLIAEEGVTKDPDINDSPIQIEFNDNIEEESTIFLSMKEGSVVNDVYPLLQGCRVYHFHDTTETAGVKGYASITDSRFLFEDAANLAPFLYRMKLTGAAYYERIVKTIQLVMPFFKDFVLEPNFQNVETIRLEWQDKYSDKVFTAHDLSDGSLRFICMATLLLQETQPSVILLDEPEIGLHPSAITILAGLLKKASKRTQVIVSTQSVSLVNEFDAEDIVVVERPAEETTMRRLDAEKLSAWLDEYLLGELWDKNVLGGKP